MLEWLLSPMDTARPHEVGVVLSWHARSMVLAWGILVPLGILIARYFKIAPGQDFPNRLDSHLWWNSHRICQYSAFAIMSVGLVLILNAPPLDVLPGPHWWLGWTVLSLGAVQVLGGLLRGSKGGPTDTTLSGDHYDMTPRRLAFEYIHKTVGYAALVLSMITILSGLWQSNAPNWMWIAMLTWWFSLGITAAALQTRGMAIDTYQAIWGPDPSLPGNRRRPIGWGISRHEDRHGVSRTRGPAEASERKARGGS